MADETKAATPEDEDLPDADEVDAVEGAPEGEGQEAGSDGAEDAAEPPELSITLEGEPVEEEDPDEAELGDKGKRALKRLREKLAEEAKARREAERRVAEAETTKAKPEAMPRPTMESCGFDDDVYAERMKAWVLQEAKAEEERKAQESAAKAAEDDYRARLDSYTKAKVALPVRDYDVAEGAIMSTLSRQQQSVMIRNLGDPAKVIYALGKSPKALAELAAIKDLDRFAFRLAKLEGEIKVTTKSPPPPEKKLPSGGAAGGGTGGSLQAQIDAAEKRAERTGDRTEVNRLKMQLRSQGKAA